MTVTRCKRAGWWGPPLALVLALAGCQSRPPVGDQLSPLPRAMSVAGFGSGFYVNETGHLITNEHVIQGCGRTAVEWRGSHVPAAVVRADPSRDLAILRTRETVARPAVLAVADSPRSLQRVSAAGYPQAFGRSVPTVIRGFVRETTTPVDLRVSGSTERFLELVTQPQIFEGGSGGPLLDRTGTVVGVVTARLSLLGNVGFAIPVGEVTAMLDREAVPHTRGVATGLASAAALGRFAAPFTVRILCLS